MKDDSLFLGQFQGLLCRFSPETGGTASRKRKDLQRGGIPSMILAFVMPILSATVGTSLAHVFRMAIEQGLTHGTYVLFSVLCAAASSIAVPAVPRQASPTLL